MANDSSANGPVASDPVAVSSNERVAIVTDSTADFCDVRPADLGVTVVPLTVNWGNDILRDRIDVTTEEFYDRLRNDPTLPKTAGPPVGIFEDLYRVLLQTNTAVVSIHLAGGFSGTASVAIAAARAVAPDRIHVVDSGSVSVGLGWLVQRAAEIAQEGGTVEAILAETQAAIPRVRLYLTLDTLDFLQRGGRIGRARAFLGSLLNVKPVLEARDGDVHPVERVRTRAAATRRLVEIASTAEPKRMIAVVHGDCEAEAIELQAQLAERHRDRSIPIVEIGAVIATYAGPGILGVGFILDGAGG